MSSAGQWRSRGGFLLAAIGFAVGLGNIWRFPYMTGENGGGLFVAVYLACALVIGVPVVIAELLIGRHGGGSPPLAFDRLATDHGRSGRWRHVGHLNLLAAVLITFLYLVVTGWVLAYLARSVGEGFAGFGALAADAEFSALLADPSRLVGWTWLALLLSMLVIRAGVQQGIERTVLVVMPLLFLLLLALVAYNVAEGGFGQALDYLFQADFSHLTGTTVLAAISQAFFSIGVAMAGMMTFGAYLPREIPLVSCALIIVLADTLVAVVAGLVIFPMVFAQGLDAAGGPGLIFQTLPVAFAQMPGGHVVSVAFFLLLSLAAITSLVGLLEAQTSWLIDSRGMQRNGAAAVVTAVNLAGSLVGALSYNVFADVSIGTLNLSTLLDALPNQLLLPLGGMFIAVFAGWLLPAAVTREEVQGQRFHTIWRALIRVVAPVAIVVTLVSGISL
ncbi:MAG: sodium-dependent transporter [Pseudomonadales bacterium]|nr:sodium-dependent transporter [Pseudomonadales bacterium]